jgi:KaiC/GvpD/RAD55 family RecA-like ATPase
MTKRIATGIEGLDEVLQGGFPKGSMILLGGNPGTGKTVFSGEFLHHGGKNYENGLYVSFAEGREAFINNMSSFGLNFESLERENRFKILDLVTMKEAGLDTLMEMITNDIDTFGVERLVIDSFTALANAFEKPIDMRITLHLLSKIIRQSGCTTIIITEIPSGQQGIGLGIEEFVADGIIILKKKWLEDRLLRELEVEKMRGTRMTETRFLFTLHNGFKIFQPFEVKEVEERKRLEPIPQQEQRFSTGCGEFDQRIGGGLLRGSMTLFEFGKNIPRAVPLLFLYPIVANFASQGMASIILPSSGDNAESIYNMAKMLLFTDEEINSFLRVMEKLRSYLKRDEKYIVSLNSQTEDEQYEQGAKLRQELKKNTGKPVLEFLGLDTAEAALGKNLKGMLDRIVTDIRIEGNLLILASKPEVGEAARYASNMADVHINLIYENGVVLFYGIRPRTSFYVVEMDCSRGYRLPKFTPIL